jgi:hypothetical protein
MQFSVFLLEITDAQPSRLRVSDVVTRDVWLIQKFIYHRGSKAVILTNGIYKNLNRECCKKSGKLAFDLVTEKTEREDTERRISSAE